MRESRKSFVQHKKRPHYKTFAMVEIPTGAARTRAAGAGAGAGKVGGGQMSEKKEPEEIMRQIMEMEKELRRIKDRTERPIPIVRDRQGRLAKDLTLKEWFAKIDEEVNEVKEVALRLYVLLSATPYKLGVYRPIMAEEVCDVIKVLYSMANQMGIDGDFLDKAMHKCNEKTRRRGCHE